MWLASAGDGAALSCILARQRARAPRPCSLEPARRLEARRLSAVGARYAPAVDVCLRRGACDLILGKERVRSVQSDEFEGVRVARATAARGERARPRPYHVSVRDDQARPSRAARGTERLPLERRKRIGSKRLYLYLICTASYDCVP